MDRYYVWEIISYAWTEIGIQDDECRKLVEEGGITSADLPEIDRMYLRDVCASFAFETFLVFPLFLWMLMPDWGFEESYLRKRMERWYSKPYWIHLLNPLRLLGYPLSLLFALKYRSMLRRAVHAKAHA